MKRPRKRQPASSLVSRGRLAALLLSLVFLAPAFTSAAWRVHTDPANHLSVGTPYSWIWIPKTRAATFRLAKKLRNEGKVHQAALVASYATDAWQSDPVRIFDAVAYPTTGSPIATDLVLTRRALPGGVAPTQASLRTVADAQFNELKSASGVRLTVPRPRSVVLKAATSVMYSGSVNAVGFGRRRTGFEIFLFIDVHGLYEAEFRSDNAYLDKEMPLFRQIANTIKLA